MYSCEFTCTTRVSGAPGVQGVLDSLELESQVEVICLVWMLETEPGPPEEQKGLSQSHLSNPFCFKLNLRQLTSYIAVGCVAFSWLTWQGVAFS